MSVADGRYAPSPSGPLHLGNLRTALLAWCFARSQGARFLLRIEDLDPQRSRREHEAGILADLERVGIDWDGPPSRQSERVERHRAAFEQLRDGGRIYPCWCSRAEIRQAASAPHPPLPGASRPRRERAYPGTCRDLSARERARRERSGAPAAWRLDAASQRVRFVDLLAGSTETVVDDFVVWRADPPSQISAGIPAYNLAVVVDDADQGIGEVVRGDDLLETTPRQILLARLLGLAVPRYAHVPLVLGPDGKRLAKRQARVAGAASPQADGAARPPELGVTLTDRLAHGESVERVTGWLASSAGLAKPGRAMRAQQVLAAFDPAKLRREPTVLDGT
jgi:glutamyl-tRNA synthetase